MAENVRLYALKSYYSSSGGGLLTLEDDVLSIVQQVRELYEDRVTVELDPSNGWYHFVGHENGTDYLIFSTEHLDPRALDRLRASDAQWIGHVDPYDAVEREQDEAQALLERTDREKVNEMGEELIFSLQREGRAPFLSKQVFVPKDIHA